MELQVKVKWVGAPTQNNSASGVFYNQDVVVESLTESSTFVVRITTGSRADNIRAFALRVDEEVEMTIFGQFGIGKETNRPFNTLNCVGVERDRTKWGRRHGTNRDNSELLAQLGNSYQLRQNPQPQPAPQAQPQFVQQPQAQSDVPF